jgi:hypothetical protein
MSAELGLHEVATERVHLPPMTFKPIFHWDGGVAMSRARGLMTRSKPTFPGRCAVCSLTQISCEMPFQMVAAGHAGPSLTREEPYPVRAAAPQAIHWTREAESLTVSVEQGLLLAAVPDAIPDLIGELVWI